MNTIVSAWCDICEHLHPFAVMALVPLLLWIHHFETYPPVDDHVVGGDTMVDAEAPEGRWAA